MLHLLPDPRGWSHPDDDLGVSLSQAQFEFALTALVEETDAMLKAASPQLQRQ